MRVNTVIIDALLHATQGFTTKNSIPFQCIIHYVFNVLYIMFKHVIVHYSIYKPLQNATTCIYNNVMYSKINLHMIIERQNIQ